MRGVLRHIPNFISAIRILLVVPIAWALLHHELMTTLCLFVVAAVSDGLDGFLAKRFGWQSDLGALLDPVADKLLLITLLVTLAILKIVPVWLMGVAVTRDLVIVIGAIAYRYWCGPLKLRPTLISKINTMVQLLFILSVVGQQLFAFPHTFSVLLGAVVFATVIVSGVDYVITYGRLAAATLAPRS